MSEIDALVADVERARRLKDYTNMHATADLVVDALLASPGPPEYRALAKVEYELHMAAYDQSLYHLSRYHADRSAEWPRKAGDLVGELFIHMNIGGLLLPAMGKWEDGVVMHQSTLGRVVALYPSASPEDQGRLDRIAMNCYAQCIRHLAQEDRSAPKEIERYCALLEANPLYQAQY